MIRIKHTAGDTDPIRLRLIRAGLPFDLTGYAVTLTVTKLHKESVVVIDEQPMIVDPDQNLNRGWATYEWQPADANIPEGLYQGRVVADNGVDRKTFPTGELRENYFVLIIND